jgi:L-ascorbate metabolism protein UlaG (beta-lactamase superfamily)
MVWLKRLGWSLLVLLALAISLLAWLLQHPPGIAPFESLRFASAPPPQTPFKVTFLGVATVLLDDGETALLTDGFFSRPDRLTTFMGKVEPVMADIDAGIARSGIGKTTGKLAAVIPLHSHYDHAMDAPEVAKRTGALLLGSSSTAMVGRGWGLPESQIQTAELRKPYRFGRFTITLYPALHTPTGFTGGEISQPLRPPVRAAAYKEGQSYAALVEHDGKRILITGTAGFVPGALKGVQADVVLLGIGAMGPRSLAHKQAYWDEVVRTVRARRVIPIHWDDFWIPSSGPMQPMPKPLDDFDASMAFLSEKARTDSVDLRLPLEWKPMDVFAGLPTPSARALAPTGWDGWLALAGLAPTASHAHQ